MTDLAALTMHHVKRIHVRRFDYTESPAAEDQNSTCAGVKITIESDQGVFEVTAFAYHQELFPVTTEGETLDIQREQNYWE